MTTADLPILLPAPATHGDHPATPRHRDEDRPTKYGPHLRRRIRAYRLEAADRRTVRAARPLTKLEEDTR